MWIYIQPSIPYLVWVGTWGVRDQWISDFGNGYGASIVSGVRGSKFSVIPITLTPEAGRYTMQPPDRPTYHICEGKELFWNSIYEVIVEVQRLKDKYGG